MLAHALTGTVLRVEGSGITNSLGDERTKWEDNKHGCVDHGAGLEHSGLGVLQCGEEDYRVWCQLEQSLRSQMTIKVSGRMRLTRDEHEDSVGHNKSVHCPESFRLGQEAAGLIKVRGQLRDE